jgi:hypothetical protein
MLRTAARYYNAPLGQYDVIVIVLMADDLCGDMNDRPDRDSLLERVPSDGNQLRKCH